MDLEVKPDSWVLPNRIGYNRYIYDTFHPSKYPMKASNKACECKDDVCEVPTNTISLFPQQRIVRDFIQVASPYRGILLYHELGAGKSGASIAAAEGYIEKKEIFILSPASLAQNYENELMKISTLGTKMKKCWSQLQVSTAKETMDVLKRYAITKIPKTGIVWVPMYEDDIPGAKVLVQGKSYTTLTSAEKERINETIQQIIRNRYKFISYNGLTTKLVQELVKKGFDNSFIIIDEIHNFISRIVNGSKMSRSLYNAIMNAKDCKLVLLSGTPIINSPYEIASLINLIRGPMPVYEHKLLKDSIQPTDEDMIAQLDKDDLYQYVDEIHYSKESSKVVYSLLPYGYVRKPQTIHVVVKEWRMDMTKTKEAIVQSLNRVPKLRLGVVSGTTQYYALPNSRDEFNGVFVDSHDIDNISLKNMDVFQRRILGTLSYYRVSGSEFFPTVLPNSIQYISMTDHQLSAYSDIRAKERSIDNAAKKTADPFSDKSSVYRAFSRMLCNFAFPEEIKRSFPQDIRKAIMKDYGENEDDSDDDDADKADKADKKEDKKRQRMIKEEYDATLKKAMYELVSGDYLARHKLKTMYSPKYAKMIDDIEGSPGTVLVYSQFRTMEGLGIFSKALDKIGYKEIEIKSTPEGYFFEDPSVFDKEYDDKRYVIFNSDRAKTNILLNIFNGAFDQLPDGIKDAIPQEYRRSQLYGKLAKIMMITQSGAEGISLKNVRRVLIMEYFWNSVRINQVIGRAVRTCSHEMLPVAERNVQIFTYIMKFTKKQMEKDFTLRTLDKEKTTDEHILEIATKKESIITQLLTLLKSSSFDCIINSKQNKPMQEGYRCYNWAINSDEDKPSFTANIKDDSKILSEQRFQVLKKNKGKVVSRNGNKFVMMNDTLYDYFSYVNAGILLPVK